MPMPAGFVEKNGSKTSDSLSGGIPGPRSIVESSTASAERAVWTVIPLGSRIHGVDDQVQQNLLQLYPIPSDGQRYLGQPGPQRHRSGYGQAGKEIEGLSHGVPPSERLRVERRFIRRG